MRTNRVAKEDPDQMQLWGTTGNIDGIRVVALDCHWSITEKMLVKTLNQAANAAAHKFRASIPASMKGGDFKQEIILRMYKEALRWRDKKAQTFERYVMITAFNRARDILRKDQREDSALVSEDQIREYAERNGYNPDELTPRQRKSIISSLRQSVVQFVPTYHQEPACEHEFEEDEDENE